MDARTRPVNLRFFFSANTLSLRHRSLLTQQRASTQILGHKADSSEVMSEDNPGRSTAERELVRLWRAWRTLKEMCKDRVSYVPADG